MNVTTAPKMTAPYRLWRDLRNLFRRSHGKHRTA